MTAAEGSTHASDAETRKALAEKALARSPSAAALFWREYRASWVAVAALMMTCLLAGTALLAPWITPQNPYDLMAIDFMDGELPPGAIGGMGQTYWLGTDAQGRDLVSALVYGLRASFIVAVSAGALAMILGTTLGLAAAYFRGMIETIIMRLVEIQLSFPAILLALIMLAIFGRGIDKTIIALMLVQWAFYARTVRGTAIAERSREYMQVALLLRLPTWRILFVHLLPNVMPPILVVASVQMANAITLEATLSFLGLGLPVTEPSLGLLIANGFDYLLSGKYWISVFPGILLMVTVFSINLVADRLREMVNPRLKR